jgi:2-amino-4-hydroxy-6-hydroxymethyldihydropteridine diphosphokinase
MPMQRAYIGLGANLGDAPAALRAAAQALAVLAHTRLVAVSSYYRSAPIDAQGPDFINAVASVDTRRTPLALLSDLQAIEDAAGRQRPFANAPRTLDLDLLFFGQLRCTSTALTLPHPRWLQRAFVVLPLLELLSDGVAPDGTRVADLLPALRDQSIERLPA